MSEADDWGPWVALRPDRALPFRVGDYVRIRTFIENAPYRAAEGWITEAVIPEYRQAVACCRPGIDAIEVSVRRPRGLKMLKVLIANLPVKVVHK